ncbi:Roadblock/LC7 domain-containing protein OS=Streptomyces tendae OX=1932 GN=GUR47_05015 PE=4 SV=1 [Streptomyces tendae]
MPGIDESLLEAMRLPGARGASLVDWISGLALGAVGEAPGGDWEATAAETAELGRHVAESGSLAAGGPGSGDAGTGKEPPVEDLIATTGDAYHLLRFVSTPFDSTVFLHLWLDRNDGNLALARIRLAEMADRLVLG